MSFTLEFFKDSLHFLFASDNCGEAFDKVNVRQIQNTEIPGLKKAGETPSDLESGKPMDERKGMTKKEHGVLICLLSLLGGCVVSICVIMIIYNLVVGLSDSPGEFSH